MIVHNAADIVRDSHIHMAHPVVKRHEFLTIPVIDIEAKPILIRGFCAVHGLMERSYVPLAAEGFQVAIFKDGQRIVELHEVEPEVVFLRCLLECKLVAIAFAVSSETPSWTKKLVNSS